MFSAQEEWPQEPAPPRVFSSLTKRLKSSSWRRAREISYANCGLPYRLGNVIAERGNLLVMKPENLHLGSTMMVLNNELLM